MEYGESKDEGAKRLEQSSAAVNSIILDYYKKFGRQRDLEQFFSLSTAESEVKDVTSLFWRRMKSQDSSDSGEKKSESSTELCRISIKCSIPEPSSSQEDTSKTKSDSESPPIITEFVEPKQSDEESVNEDNQSQKSMDATLDTSTNKPFSPTSSITSQRKLEWDSLADVGYANESDKKTSASSLSTLERLALKQQYSNNDSKENIGPPTAHSTMVDVNDDIPKNSKKGPNRKTTRIYQKDVDIVEVNVPHRSEISPSQAINVNLTKHISFNMDKEGHVSVEKFGRDLNVSPDQGNQNSASVSFVKLDKEIQTSLTKTKEKSVSPAMSIADQIGVQKAPVLISLNTLRKKYRRKKLKVVRKKIKSKTKIFEDKENIPVQEKSAEQVSAAESFEYMPGHVYNQNQMHLEQPRDQSRSVNNTDNKSSLESSGAITTDSSKASKHSFTKDLEKSIELLKTALHKQRNDSELKSKLIKEVVQRLLKTRYRDDESSTDFLSGLSFSSKKLGLGEKNITTSTSDNTTDNGNNSQTKPKLLRPKKSILRLDKFNSNALASTSQSAPNLPAVSNSENLIVPNPIKPHTSNTESDVSSGAKHSSDTAFAKTSSEELYHKYLEALHREEAYKKHLRDKEMFLKQKLVSSDTAFNAPQVPSAEVKVNNRLKDLIKDLTRNNYDDGSGDASKLEGGSNTNTESQRNNAVRKQRSHSVFTLSSHNSDDNRKPNLKKRLQSDIKDTKAYPGKDHCSCQHQFVASKVGVVDSSVQVNIKSLNHECSLEREKQPSRVVPCDSRCSNRDSPKNIAHILSDDVTGDIKYVCLCSEKMKSPQEMADNMLIFKCSRLTNRGIQLEDTESKTSNSVAIQCMGNSLLKTDSQCQPSTSKSIIEDVDIKVIKSTSSCNLSEMITTTTKCSQTNITPGLFDQKSCSTSSSLSHKKNLTNLPKSPARHPTAILNRESCAELTRCIQTEISINPRISDPSLNDINIINDEDCVRIITKQIKNVPESTNNVDNVKCDCSSNNAKYNEDTAKRLDEQFIHKNNTAVRNLDKPSLCCKLDKQIQSDAELNNNEVITQTAVIPENCSGDNYRIPIQGTNMTLMVKIDSKAQELTNVSEKVATHCIGTDETEIVEKATCLREECSKGVQSQNTDIFEMMSRDNGGCCSSSQEEQLGRFQKYSLLNTCTGDRLINTYPKIVHPRPKPIIRCNTDTGRFMSGQCCQTESIEKNDAVTQQHSCKDECQTENAIVVDSYTCAKSKTSSGKSSKSGCCEEPKESSSEAHSRKSSCDCVKDPILDIIRDITKRYGKKDFETAKKKKCFKEIMTVLNYLLDTEEVIDQEQIKCSASSSARDTDYDCSKKVQEKHTHLNITKRDRSPCPCGKKSPQKGHKCVTETKKEKPGCSSCGKKIQDTDSSCSEAARKVCFDCRIKSKKVRDKTPSSCSSKKGSTVCSSSSQKDEEKIISTCSESSKVKSAGGQKVKEKFARTCAISENKKTKTTTAYCVMVDKSVQCSCKKSNNYSNESSEIHATTDFPSTSTESTTCKVLNKIKRECEKYHQKRCKSYANKRCEISSSTSVNCEQCKRVHHCLCRGHRCHRTKSSAEKIKKKCLAYNLIIQTSDSMISEECAEKKDCGKQLQNIVVKVPSKCKKMEKEPFKEVYTSIEHHMPPCNPRGDFRSQRSRSCPNESEISSDGCVRRRNGYTVRDYLEMNRPDFVEKTSNRQQCLKMISEKRANERDVQRQLLSVQLDRRPSLTSLSETELRRLAKDLGINLKRKTPASKFISEREMKKHSEKIYKSLPEVVQKKEDSKKENIKKTNLLMANIFKKNLQKKTLRGAVNLSNYSTVIKI